MYSLTYKLITLIESPFKELKDIAIRILAIQSDPQKGNARDIQYENYLKNIIEWAYFETDFGLCAL